MKREKKLLPKIKSQVKFLFFALLAVLAGFVFIYSGASQDLFSSQTFEVSPASQEVTVDPGKTINLKATIKNRSRDTLPMKVRVEDFTASGEEGQVELVQGGAYSLVSWTSVTPETFTLAPGASQQVNARMQVPSNSAGGRYGSFVFGVAPQGVPKGSVATLSQEVASLFLVKINAPTSEKLSLEEFSSPQFLEYGPVPFTLKFKNSGNIHVKTLGLVNVTNMLGQRVTDVVVKATNIFPGSERVIHPALEKKFLLGKYTALAVINYGSKNDVITATTTFFVFPYRLVAIVLVIFILLYLVRKRLQKAWRALMGK